MINDNIKSIVIVGNCYSHEIKRLLLSNAFIKKNYEINVFLNYLGQPSENYVNALKNADLVICQNVKNIEYYAPLFIEKNIRNDAIVYKFEFFRFNGFWPIDTALQRYSNWFWFPVDEFGDDLNYDDYIGIDIDRNQITNNFDIQMKVFQKMNNGMDYNPSDYFLKIYNSIETYSDYWHPTPVMFFPFIEEILLLLGSADLFIDKHGESLINTNRRRLIFKSVGDALDLNYDYLGNFNFFGYEITPEEYYYFAKFLKSENFLSGLEGMNDLLDKLKIFLGDLNSR